MVSDEANMVADHAKSTCSEHLLTTPRSLPSGRKSTCSARMHETKKAPVRKTRWPAGALSPRSRRKTFTSCVGSPPKEFWNTASERWQQNVSALRKKLGRVSLSGGAKLQQRASLLKSRLSVQPDVVTRKEHFERGKVEPVPVHVPTVALISEPMEQVPTAAPISEPMEEVVALHPAQLSRSPIRPAHHEDISAVASPNPISGPPVAPTRTLASEVPLPAATSDRNVRLSISQCGRASICQLTRFVKRWRLKGKQPRPLGYALEGGTQTRRRLSGKQRPPGALANSGIVAGARTALAGLSKSRKKWVNALAEMGFVECRIAVAVRECSTMRECIDWLCPGSTCGLDAD